jgi:hypothetical protein
MLSLKSSKDTPAPGPLFRGRPCFQVHLLAHLIEALDQFGIGADADFFAFSSSSWRSISPRKTSLPLFDDLWHGAS